MDEADVRDGGFGHFWGERGDGFHGEMHWPSVSLRGKECGETETGRCFCDLKDSLSWWMPLPYWLAIARDA